MAFALVFAALTALAPEPIPLRVAAVFNLTGSMASVDRPGFDGMKLAAEQLNTTKRFRITVVPIDCKSDPAKGTAALRAAMRSERFDAVAGLYDSDYALAVGKVAQRSRVPFVTSGATLPNLPAMIGNYAFMACYGDDDQARAMAQFARDVLTARTAAVLSDPRYEYTRTISTDFPKAFTLRGGKWLMTVKDPDPGQSKKIKFGSDVVYAATLPDDAGLAVKGLRASGFDGPILSGDGFDTPLLTKQAGNAAYKVFFTTHVAYDSPNLAVRQFVSAYRSRFKREPETAAAALAYDTLRLIADAASRRGSRSLRDAIEATTGFKGVTGEISFENASREPRKSVTVVEILGNQRIFRAQVDRP